MATLTKPDNRKTSEPIPPEEDDIRTVSVINMTAAVWMIVAPLILVFTEQHAASWNTCIIDILVLAFAWIRTAVPERHVGLSWLNALIGLWSIISPVALGYSDIAAATWNNVVVGIIMVYLSVRNATTPVPSHS